MTYESAFPVSGKHCDRYLENLSIIRPFGTPSFSDSGSCNATEMADGDLESLTSSSFAPEESPDNLMFYG